MHEILLQLHIIIKTEKIADTLRTNCMTKVSTFLNKRHKKIHLANTTQVIELIGRYFQ